MELAFVVYLISIVENVSGFSALMSVLCGTLAFFLGFIKLLASANDDELPYTGKTPVLLFVGCFFFAGLKAILPSEKQGYMIAGAYVTQKIAENEKVQDIGGKVLTLINTKLEEAIAKKPEGEKAK